MKFCTGCGTQLADEAQFCSVCGKRTEEPQAQAGGAGGKGQPQAGAGGAGENRQPPAAPDARTAKKGPGWILFLLLGFAAAAIVMVILLATGILRMDLGGSEPRLEGEGFDSPEEAAVAYAEYLKKGDLEGMLSTFAVESYVDNFDLEAYCELLGNFQLYTASSLGTAFPDGEGLAEKINVEMRRGTIIDRIYYQYMVGLLSGTELEVVVKAGQLVTPPDQREEQLDELMRVLRQDPGFSNMKIGEALCAEDMLSEDDFERYLKNLDRSYRGADEIQDVCLELTIDGEDYRLFIQTGRYHGKWYNLTFDGVLGSMSGISVVSGGLCPAD